MEKSYRHYYTRRISVLAVMTALAVISSLSFPMGLTFRVGTFIKISPVFIVTALTGCLYGWRGSTLVAALADIIQGMLFGGVSWLIVLTKVFTGAMFGLFLHKSYRITRIIIAVAVTQIIGSLGLTSLALMLEYGMTVEGFYLRMVQTAVQLCLQPVVLWLLLPVVVLPARIKKLAV